MPVPLPPGEEKAHKTGSIDFSPIQANNAARSGELTEPKTGYKDPSSCRRPVRFTQMRVEQRSTYVGRALRALTTMVQEIHHSSRRTTSSVYLGDDALGNRSAQPQALKTWFLVLAALLWWSSVTVRSQEPQHLPTPRLGGMPGLPVMTGIQRTTNGMEVTWFGPSGYYQLLQKLGLADAAWRPVGGLTLSNHAIVPLNSINPLFRVSGPVPQYGGDKSCASCHEGVHAAVLETAHAAAFSSSRFRLAGGQTNSSCLPCHSVGAGLPSGFTTPQKTPHLANVQCESCHGPSARHAASPEDFTVRPRVEIASQLCGGCHSADLAPTEVRGSHPPHFEAWNASGHQAVREELKEDFTSGTGTSTLIPNCGRCHSGSVRAALKAGTVMPNGHEAAAVGIACATCHDTHSQHTYNNPLHGVVSFTNLLTGSVIQLTNQALGAHYTTQLREPLSSVEDYHSTGNFATNYNPAINLCAQCHNDRGATFTKTDRPPHRSPQYNMLLGTVGELPDHYPAHLPSTHSRIEKQCVSCHMQTTSQGEMGHSGHHFKVTSYEACASCHGSAENAQAFAAFVKGVILSLSSDVKTALDKWAVTRAAPGLRKYGALAWEYQNAGGLSTTSGALAGPVSSPNDPARDEQRLIPLNIQKARFNLYLVINDGSYGAHNGPYAISLLSAALAWIEQENTQPNRPQ